ncbi:MAG TPA: fumarylacetoacetate hydrolase family protein [Actinomycetota bacterium]|nr:fumarylacetoacetate hydrolase family protein [Actinomycetota bacterium]
MRLITYDRGGARRLGACVGETVVDLPEAVGHPAFPPTMEALVRHIGGSILDAAHDILDDEEVVDECTVPRPRLLPVIVPSPESMTLLGEQGRITTLHGGCFAGGIACIVGAGRARRMSRHESRIFGYTLFAHWTNGSNGRRAATTFGPCVVTVEHVGGAALELELRINGEPHGVKTLESPNEFFGGVLAEASQERPFEAGDVLAWMSWTIRTNGKALPFQDVELSADPIGALRLHTTEAAGPKS